MQTASKAKNLHSIFQKQSSKATTRGLPRPTHSLLHSAPLYILSIMTITHKLRSRPARRQSCSARVPNLSAAAAHPLEKPLALENSPGPKSKTSTGPRRVCTLGVASARWAAGHEAERLRDFRRAASKSRARA